MPTIPADDLADVWCSRCPAPATQELLVTDGSSAQYSAAYCDTCAVNVKWAAKIRAASTPELVLRALDGDR